MKPALVLQHLPDDGPAFLATWLQAQGRAMDLRHTSVGDLYPDDIHAYGALAVLGGEWGANDDRPSLRQAERLIRQAVDSGVPVLGHCLGGQLLSRALGGQVGPSSTPERGWHEVDVDPSEAASAWFGEATRFVLFQWHSDTFSVPPCAQRVATGGACANQAFALGPHLGMQFHLEVDAAKLRAWADEAESAPLHHHDGLASWHGGARLRQDSASCLAGSQALASRVYARWLRFAR